MGYGKNNQSAPITGFDQVRGNTTLSVPSNSSVAILSNSPKSVSDFTLTVDLRFNSGTGSLRCEIFIDGVLYRTLERTTLGSDSFVGDRILMAPGKVLSTVFSRPSGNAVGTAQYRLFGLTTIYNI